MADLINAALALSLPFMFGIVLGCELAKRRNRHPAEQMIDDVRKRCQIIGADEHWEVVATAKIHRKGHAPLYIRVGTTEAA